MVLSYASTSGVKNRLGPTGTTNDALLGVIVNQVNSYIEGYCGRPVGPETGATYTLDGQDSLENVRCLPVRRGIRTITLLEIAPYTGAPYVTIPSTDYFVRPSINDRATGWPGQEVWMTDIPTATNPYPYFPRGFDTVRITGDWGWEAIPADITEIAEVASVRAWQARNLGQSDMAGTDELGEPVISNTFSARDRMTLNRYRYHDVEII